MTHATGLDARDVWEATLTALRADTSMTTPAYKTWFEQTTPVEVRDETIVVVVPNGFARDWLESRFAGLLSGALEQVVGRPMRVDFVVDSSTATPPAEEAPAREEPVIPDLAAAEERRVQEAQKGDFNPKYTFDSFVMGSSNRFAYHSALAVAEAPGRAYNPLFIYGGVGLGKTHLLQGIGHYVQNTYTHLRVKYVSSEQFTNDFINSIGDKARIEGFRRQYRTNDVLLVDDIQFIAGKTGTEEEFFHTFNTLQQAGKQIVLSSDSPPKDITQLAERLRSRFEMGLITDIQPPELETRVAILRRKVEIEGLLVPDEVLTFIASRIASNIRELEGALIRVVAFGSLTRHEIDTEIAQSVLKDIFPERSARPISVSTIQQEACRFYGLSRADLIGNKRSQAIVYPRQVAMHLARELTDLSLPRIGAEFGGRDHTTVMHATAKITKMLTEQREVYNQIQQLTNLIKQKS